MEYETFLTTEKDLNDFAKKIPYKRWKESKLVSIVGEDGRWYILVQTPKLSISEEDL